MVSTIAPGGFETERSWTPRGELESITDPEGAVVSYVYDAAGHLASVTDALQHTTGYAYDARGNRLSRTNALGGIESWSYDGADRPTSHRDTADTVASIWTYDALGRLATVADASGRTETRAYDRGGRLTGQSWASGTETLVRTRSWDPAGRLASVSGPDGMTSYAYDEAGNLLFADAPGADADLAYAWDLAGRRTSLTHPDGAVVTTIYDPLGRPATMSHPTLGATAYAWDGDGRLLGEDLPGEGNDRAWTYDPSTGQATGYTQHLGGATLQTSLGHDRANRVVSAATAGGEAVEYRYDDAGQLVAVDTNATATHEYAYDALGRRTRSTDPAGTFDYAYDDAGRLLSRTTPDPEFPLSVKAQVNGQTVGTVAGHRPGDATYAYDPAGRRTTRTATEGTTTYAYGPDGRLATTQAGATTTRAAYDAPGRLAAVTVEDGTPDTTRLVWDDSAVPTMVEVSDARGRTELIGGDGLVGITTPAGPSLVSTDHLGSVLATPATASLVAAGSYGPYGEIGATRAEPSLGYRGEMSIGDSLHLRARDYDPATGSFTTVDPLPPVAGSPVQNPYNYAANDPLNKTDPLGLRPSDCAFSPCSVVIDDTIDGRRSDGPSDALTAHERCFNALGFKEASHEAANLAHIDEGLIYGTVWNETRDCNAQGSLVNGAADTANKLGIGDETSFGPANLPASVISATVDRHSDELRELQPYGDLSYMAKHTPSLSIAIAAFRLKDLESEVYAIARTHPNQVKVVSLATFASQGRQNDSDNTWHFAMSAVLHQGYYSAGGGMGRLEDVLLRHVGFEENEIGQPNGFGSWMKTSHLTLSMCNAIAELNISDTSGFKCL